jgi:hypothetical protein
MFCLESVQRAPGSHEGFVVMGSGFGHITKQANRSELGAKLRKLASNCRANCIAYEIPGSEFRVRFLRLRDDIFEKHGGISLPKQG